MPPQPPIIIPPPAGTRHTSTLIFLHGLGDVGSSFTSLFGSASFIRRFSSTPAHGSSNGHRSGSDGSGMCGMKVILPTAPVGRVTINGGAHMTRWYDILSLSHLATPTPTSGPREDQTGLEDSMMHTVVQLAKEDARKGIKIAVGGFSQGGAVCLYTLMRVIENRRKRGGESGDVREMAELEEVARAVKCCVVLSSYLPVKSAFQSLFQNTSGAGSGGSGSGGGDGVHVWMAHGKWDELIPVKHAKQSMELMKQVESEGWIKSVSWDEYEGVGHGLCEEEVDKMAEFLAKHLK